MKAAVLTEILKPLQILDLDQEGPRAGEAPPSATQKLVQKGYYLTDEQVRRLGITAVMKGVDRSTIVREALDRYFAMEGTGI